MSKKILSTGNSHSLAMLALAIASFPGIPVAGREVPPFLFGPREYRGGVPYDPKGKCSCCGKDIMSEVDSMPNPLVCTERKCLDFWKIEREKTNVKTNKNEEIEVRNKDQ